MECGKCKKVLSKRGSHFVCQGSCAGVFHRTCVKGLDLDLKAGRTRTHCHNCADEDTDGEEQEYAERESFEKILKDIQKKVHAIPGFKKQLDEIKASMSVLSEKYDLLTSEHAKAKERISTLEKTVSNISNKCVYLEKQTAAYEQKLLEFEQCSRKQNIEIVGLEQLPEENVISVVTRLGDKLNLNTADIEWARRNHPRKQNGDKPASIIVGFKSTGTGARDAWLAQRRRLAELTSDAVTGGTKTHKIYINEDLPKPTRALLWNTKKRLHGPFRFIWISNGKVLVKKAEGDKTLWIRAESDVNDLLKVK